MPPCLIQSGSGFCLGSSGMMIAAEWLTRGSNVDRRSVTIAAGVAGALVLALAAILLAVSARPAQRPNVLLLTLDTTRADALGAYGAAPGSTPRLDDLASRSIVFDRAWTTAPLTLPAHASLLTGLYPRSHGVRRNADFRLPEGTQTLASMLREAGYATAAFVSSIVLDRGFGLDTGFDLYDDLSGSGAAERRASDVASKAIAWLDERPREPFLLWVHFFDPHAPYDPPEAFRARFRDPYAGEVAFADEEVGRILKALDARGFGERTLIVVAGDHGEDRHEHGEPEHGVLLYEGSLRVPLIVRPPGSGQAQARDARPASLVDVTPTILELLDVAKPSGLQGRALLGRSKRDEGGDAGLLAETTLPEVAYRWSALDAFLLGRFKLIVGSTSELYDLASDPGEERDLAAQEPDRVRDLEGRLARQRDALPSPRGESRYRPSPKDREALAALGYVAGRSDPPPAAIDRPDPRSVIRVLPLLAQGRAALKGGRASDAAEHLRRAAKIDPKNPRVLDALGVALQSIGKLEEARVTLEMALASDPRSPEILANLGAVLEASGDRHGAENAYRNAISLDSSLPGPQLNLLLLLFESERFLEARSQSEAAHRLAPELPTPLLISGYCREALGDTAGARLDFVEAVRLAERGKDSRESLLAGAEAAFRIGESARGEALAKRLLERHPEAEAEAQARLGEWRRQ